MEKQTKKQHGIEHAGNTCEPHYMEGTRLRQGQSSRLSLPYVDEYCHRCKSEEQHRYIRKQYGQETKGKRETRKPVQNVGS